MVHFRVHDVRRPVFRIYLVTFFLLGVGSGPGMAEESVESTTSTTSSTRQVLEVVCTQCHSLAPITMLRDGALGWENTVKEMVLRGAHLSPGEVELITQYLTQNYGLGINPMKTGILPPEAVVRESDAGMLSEDIVLPAGRGQEQVQGRCKLCHDLGRVVSVRRTAEDWDRITKDMTSRGIPASPQETNEMASYLVTHFGEE